MDTTSLFDEAVAELPQPAPAAKAPGKPSATEALRTGHVVSKCGVATFEYLADYAARRGMQTGKPTKAGRTQHGKHCSLLVVDGQVVRGSFVEDIKGDRKLRRLSPRRFCWLVNAFAQKKEAPHGQEVHG